MQVTTIGLDIAKNVFQVHGIDNEGRVVLRRKVRRDQLVALFRSLEPCLVGMEACATAHHWGARANGPWPPGQTDAASVCEGLREAEQE